MTATTNLNGQRVNLDISDLQPIGLCNTCDTDDALFNIPDSFWDLRNDFFCTNCKSRPRERALFSVLESHFPLWYKMDIHEHNPIFRGLSNKLKMHNTKYSYSHNKEHADTVDEKHYVNGNLEKLDIAKQSKDLFITQDVLNTTDNVIKSLKEIKRVLKPGGAHVFTIPFIKGANRTDGQEYGYDLIQLILKETGMFSFIHTIDDSRYAIRGLYNDVVVSFKQK